METCAIKVVGPCLRQLYEWESVDQTDSPDFSPVLTDLNDASSNSCAVDGMEGLELGEAATPEQELRSRTFLEDSPTSTEHILEPTVQLHPLDNHELTVLPSGDPATPEGRPQSNSAPVEDAVPSPPLSPTLNGEVVPPWKYDIKERMRQNVRAAHEQLECSEGWKKEQTKSGTRIFVKDIGGMTHIKCVSMVK